MSLTDFLKRIPAFNLALSAAAVAITKTVLQGRLIPDNMDWLAAAGILVSIVAFLCVYARSVPAKGTPWLILAALVSLVCLLIMHIRLVETFDFYGQAYRELRGWDLSSDGIAIKANLEKTLGMPVSIHDLIKYSGHSEMLALYGSNWYASATLYSGSFLMFLFTVIAVAGRFELDFKDSPAS
jgi:hypothetical protein